MGVRRRFNYGRKQFTEKKALTELEDNPVREFLHAHVGVRFSRNTLAKRLKINKRKITYYSENSRVIRRCTPEELHSNKYIINVYTYNHETNEESGETGSEAGSEASSESSSESSSE